MESSGRCAPFVSSCTLVVTRRISDDDFLPLGLDVFHEGRRRTDCCGRCRRPPCVRLRRVDDDVAAAIDRLGRRRTCAVVAIVRVDILARPALRLAPRAAATCVPLQLAGQADYRGTRRSP